MRLRRQTAEVLAVLARNPNEIVEKEQLIKDAEEVKERILKEASQKALEISEKSQRNADFIRKELEQKIDERASLFL